MFVLSSVLRGVDVGICVPLGEGTTLKISIPGAWVKGGPKTGVKGVFKPGVAMSSAGRGGNSDGELSLDSEVLSGPTRTSLVRSKCSNRRTKIASNFFTMSWRCEVFVGNSTGSTSPNSPASEERSLKVSPSPSASESELGSWPTIVSNGSSSKTSSSARLSSSSNSSSSICISTYGND
jgi:hypothetical protein